MFQNNGAVLCVSHAADYTPGCVVSAGRATGQGEFTGCKLCLKKNMYLSIYFKGRVRERDKEFLHPLVQSTNDRIDQIGSSQSHKLFVGLPRG